MFFEMLKKIGFFKKKRFFYFFYLLRHKYWWENIHCKLTEEVIARKKKQDVWRSWNTLYTKY